MVSRACGSLNEGLPEVPFRKALNSNELCSSKGLIWDSDEEVDLGKLERGGAK